MKEWSRQYMPNEKWSEAPPQLVSATNAFISFASSFFMPRYRRFIEKDFCLCKSLFRGAGGGTRTHTPLLTWDFKSHASAIPPHRQVSLYKLYFKPHTAAYPFATTRAVLAYRPCFGGTIQIWTGEWRFCRPLPYHLAMVPTTVWSGRRDSDPRLSPWQGDTLPLSHSREHWYYTKYTEKMQLFFILFAIVFYLNRFNCVFDANFTSKPYAIISCLSPFYSDWQAL